MLLRSISIANLIEKKLNELGSAKSYTFRVFDSVGDNKPSNDIKCVLHQFKGDMEPLKNHIDIDYGYVLEMAIPTANANDELIAVREIVDELLIELNASSVALDGGNCLFNFSTTTPKDYKMEFGVGDITPIAFTINVRYTQNAITSYDKHWLLDGVEIPFLKEMVTLNKEGTPNKINKDNYAKALITGQAKYYKFDFQYNTDDPISVGLQKDILQGEFEKTYTLTYYDGVAFTQDNPFSSLVTIFRDANSSVERTQTGMFSVTFTDFDDNVNAKYYLALIDTQFDLQEKNTRYFEATADKTAEQVQQEYYANKITNGGADYELIKAPNLNSLDITSQIYRNVRNYDLFDLMNKNYAVIKVEREDKPTRYFYYFITQSNIGAGNQITCDLKLDSIQTYMFNSDLKIAECMIKRAHLNRWCNPNQKFVSFDLDEDSAFYTKDDYEEQPKHLVESTNIYFHNVAMFGSSEKSLLTNWIQQNIAYWVYVFVDGQHNYPLASNNVVNGEDIRLKVLLPNNGMYSYISPWGCWCYPVYKSEQRIFVNSKIIERWAGEDYIKRNNLASYVYSQKISAYCPIDFTKCKYEIDQTGLHFTSTQINNSIIDCGEFNAMDITFSESGTTYPTCLLTAITQSFALRGDLDIITDNDVDTIFQSSELTGGLIDPKDFWKYNPKLLSIKYQDYRITDIAGNDFKYDIQKLKGKPKKFLLSENLSPDISRTYIRFMGSESNDFYKLETNKSYLGLTNSIDNIIGFNIDRYGEYVANNKNFAMRAVMTATENVVGGAIGGALLGKGPLGVAAGFAGAGKTLINQAIEIDDMKNAPSTAANTNGNALQNLFARGDLNIRLEYHRTSLNNLIYINMQYMLYGYSYNRIGDIKDFINARKYYNYIEAEVDAIDGVAMSNTARENIRQRFESGVRFWNSDNIDYDKFNYEKILEK